MSHTAVVLPKTQTLVATEQVPYPKLEISKPPLDVQAHYTKQVETYLNNYSLNELSNLVNDYNTKIVSHVGMDTFLNNVFIVLTNVPVYADKLKPSEAPNWRGFTGLRLISKQVIEHPEDYHIAQKYLLLLKRSKDKGLDFDLSLADIKRLLRLKRCYYTKEPLTDHDPNLSSHRTFDRVDNKKGYTKDNVVVCATQFNQLKSNLFEAKTSLCYTDPQLLYKFVKTYLNK